MTSVTRFTAVTKELPIKFTGISGPWYNDLIMGEYQLYPFVVSKLGELDLNLEYDGFATWFNNGSVPQSTDTDGFAPAKLLGGQQLITSLGPNLKQYIRNWYTSNDGGNPIDGGANGTSPINIYINPVMTKVQLSKQRTLDASDAAFTNSDQAPSSDSYIFGDATDTFKTSWIFKTPLTFTYQSGGNTRYVTMYSLLQTDYA
jgi:hypothetical protein